MRLSLLTNDADSNHNLYFEIKYFRIESRPGVGLGGLPTKEQNQVTRTVASTIARRGQTGCWLLQYKNYILNCSTNS